MMPFGLLNSNKQLAKALKGVNKVKIVDADEHSSQYGVRGFPTIKIFGAKKTLAHRLQWTSTAKATAEPALAEAKKKVQAAFGGGSSGTSSGGDSGKDDVIEFTDDNFDKLVLQSEDDWLVEFFVPLCGHCKLLAPEWVGASTSLYRSFSATGLTLIGIFAILY